MEGHVAQLGSGQDPGKMRLARAEASEGMWYNEQSPRMANWGPQASCITSLSLTVCSRVHITQAVGGKGGNVPERSGQRGCSLCSSLFPPEFGPRALRRCPNCRLGTLAFGSLTSKPGFPQTWAAGVRAFPTTSHL